LINRGVIFGGGNYYYAATGIELASGGMATNSGTITGGAGGGGSSARTGGAGAELASGGTLANSGAIVGGASGAVGGNGVNLNGGTLVTSGTIGGGLGALPGTDGDAVQFGSVAATLVIDPGAVFGGLVVANATAADLLRLAGTTTGRLSGLGTEFANFYNIDVAKGAHWNLAGANTLAGPTSLAVRGGAILAVNGSLDISGTVTLAGAGRLGGGGVVAIDPGSVLDVNCHLATKHLSFLAGGGETLMVARPANVSGTIAGFGASARNAIDLVGVVAKHINYTPLTSASGQLTLTGTAGAIATLHFSGGNYHTSQFHLAVSGGSSHISFG
jgi:hypothetical protein